MERKYRDFFDIDPGFEPYVDYRSMRANPKKWKQFFPHKTFVKLLKSTISVLDRKQKLSLWVEGAYGTGKSHAVLTLKYLLSVNKKEVEGYFNEYNLDHDLYNNFERIREEGPILTVYVGSSSSIHNDNDLILTIQEEIEKALKEAKIPNKAGDSLRGAIIRYLSDAENKESFSVFVNNSYAHLFGGDNVDDIIKKLREYDGEPLRELMEKIFRVSEERQILAFKMTTDDLANWIKDVIAKNGLKSIVFIWDEFTEYLKNNRGRLSGFQEIVQLSQIIPFYFIIVTHVSSSIFPEGDQEFKKINDRFVAPHNQISLPENIAFQLMGTALKKNKDPIVKQEWDTIVLPDLSERTSNVRKQVSKKTRITSQEMIDILPLHPYTALLLKHISSAFDSNQRSMFDFIKNDRGDEIKGFQWFIDNYGPYGDHPLLTVDMLWDFFYEKGKDNLARDVRQVLDYFGQVERRIADSDEVIILKAALLLQAISQHTADAVEMFIPNDDILKLAFQGSVLERTADKIAKKLVNDKILFRRDLGKGQFQYNAYINEVSSAELERFEKQIDTKSTTDLIKEELKDGSSVTDALEFASGALKLRYKVEYVSQSDFDKIKNKFRNMEPGTTGKIGAIACFAKNDTEAVTLRRKITEAISTKEFPVVFIDLTGTPFGIDGYEQYRKDMANSLYQQHKNGELARQYANNAKDCLKTWKDNIENGSFIIYTNENPKGKRVVNKDQLEEVLLDIDKGIFPDCLEGTYEVLPTMYFASNFKLGVECGVNRKTKQVFSSHNTQKSLETALKDAWNDPEYWSDHPNLLISRIKRTVDETIKKEFQHSGRISIRSLYEVLKAKPYGFMACNLTAFILGFVLKDYVNGKYSWSNGLINETLDLEKLKEMIDKVLKLQNTPNDRYQDSYIVTMTPEERAFNHSSGIVFGVPPASCTSVEQTRGIIRNQMKQLHFPIWVLVEILPEQNFETPAKVLKELINGYVGIANSANIEGGKTDTDIANNIGKIYLEYPKAQDDLKTLATKENCQEGMKRYLDMYEGGKLPSLAEKINDGGKYINVVRDAFDADAANWVWNKDTVNKKINGVILDYEIISESNKILPGKSITLEETYRSFCKLQIRISYEAAKDFFRVHELEPLTGILYEIKKLGRLYDEKQKTEFLNALQQEGAAFKSFYLDGQMDCFKEICAYYLEGLSDKGVIELYNQISASSSYLQEKKYYYQQVKEAVSKYKEALGYNKLKMLWESKTHLKYTPRQWSQKHSMPLLCLVPDEEVTEAKEAFRTLNEKNPSAESIKNAMAYLERATFYPMMNDETALDQIFMKNVVKDYAVMLTDVSEVKQYLLEHLNDEPYDWFRSPEVDNRIKQMAEAKYNEGGADKALEKIDQMDEEEVKHYLKDLIKDNMTVGMEIIKNG